MDIICFQSYTTIISIPLNIICISYRHTIIYNRIQIVPDIAAYAWNRIEKKATKTNSDVSTLLPHLNSNTDIHIYVLADTDIR
jgi:hypothetical protein